MKANVDLLPLAVAGTAEIVLLNESYPSPAKGRDSLDSTHAAGKIHAIVYSEANYCIKCTEHFLPTILVEVTRT